MRVGRPPLLAAPAGTNLGYLTRPAHRQTGYDCARATVEIHPGHCRRVAGTAAARTELALRHDRGGELQRVSESFEQRFPFTREIVNL